MGTSRLRITIPALMLFAVACRQPQPPALRTDRPVPVYVSQVRDELSWNAPFVTVDVDTDHAVRYRDEIIFDPAVDDPIVLTRALAALRQAALDAGDITTMPKNVGGEWQHVIVRPLRILGHKWSLWSTTQQVMQAASQPELGFWKVQLALFEPAE